VFICGKRKSPKTIRIQQKALVFPKPAQPLTTYNCGAAASSIANLAAPNFQKQRDLEQFLHPCVKLYL